MASSNRHWPSMFKSKPCNPSQQWQHDINSSLISTACQKTPCTSVLQGSEERSPEPKPRWNPKPEQIRILEAIFNSGMVNPPRDEIRKIRAQLQQYGQVGDANVFYWFQNRKSRSKHKQRHHLPPPKQPSHSQPIATSSSTVPPGTSLCGPTATSSSSSSSQKSSPGPIKIKTLAVDTVPNVLEISNSPTAPVNQGLLQHHGCDYSAHDPFYFQVQQSGDCAGLSQNCCFSELSKMVQLAEQGHGQGHSPCSDLLLSELTAAAVASSKNQDKLKPEQNHCYTINEIPEVGGSSSVGVGSGAGATKVTVFINDVAFDVAVGPLNLRDAFGDKAVLYNSSGQPVPTNEWGITLSALQHGAVYYLV